jgi:hypothetical protein
MTRGEGVWQSKLYCKQISANFERSQNRYRLLKNNALNIYPKLRLHQDNNYWTVNQKIVPKNNTNFLFNNLQLRKIAKKLDEISNFGIIHGDLCFSNIAFDQEENVLLYDWEINLEISDNNNLILRTTPYCLHPLDEETNNITKLSDRFSIAALTMISRHNPSWRSYLSFNQTLRRRLADYIDSIPKFSNIELVDRILHKIKN